MAIPPFLRHAPMAASLPLVLDSPHSGEHYPDDVEHLEYLRKYNTRPALRLIRPLAPGADVANRPATVQPHTE